MPKISEEKKIEKVSQMFKALSNPNRLKIFMRLISCCQSETITSIKSETEPKGCICVAEIGRDVEIAPSTLSHHLKELRHAGIIVMKRRGQKIDYCIDPIALSALKEFFS